MNETELYTYFKQRSDSFNEMPSAELWNKISTKLDNAPQKAISKSLISKLFLFTALIISGGLLIHNQDPKIENQDIILNIQDSITVKNDSLKINLKNNVLKPNKTPTIQFKRLPNHKNPEDKTVVFQSKTNSKNDSVSKNILTVKDGKIELIPSELPQNPIQKPIELENTHVLNATNRVVVTSDKKLSKPEFDDFVNKAIKASQVEIGKLLIVKAVGHKPFRHLISDKKPDSIATPSVKLLIPELIFKIDSIK